MFPFSLEAPLEASTELYTLLLAGAVGAAIKIAVIVGASILDYGSNGQHALFIGEFTRHTKSIRCFIYFSPEISQNALLYAYLRHFQNHQNLS